MPDNSFVVRAVVDINQLTVGMNAASQVIKGSVGNINTTFTEAASATTRSLSRITDDTRAAARSVSQGWIDATAKSLAYRDSLKEISAATYEVRRLGTDDADAMAVLAAAKQKGAALNAELAESERAVGLAARKTAEENIQARLTTDMLTGNFARADQALIRFASHSELIGPLIQAAFVPFAVAAFVEILIRAGEKAYKLYENIILLKGSIEDLEKADSSAAEKAASLNYEYEESVARRLEALGKLRDAEAMFAKAAADKPLEVIKIDDKNFKQFNKEFVTFLQAVHTSSEAPTVIARIQAEADSATKQLQEAKAARDELLQALSTPDPGIAESGAGMAVSLKRQEKLVVDLTEKINLLRNAAAQVQSETAIAAENAASRAAGIDKKANKDSRLDDWRTQLQAKRDDEDGFHELSKADEVKFWADKLATVQAGSKIYAEVLHQMREADRAGQKESLKDEDKAVRDRVAATKPGSAERVAIYREELTHLKSIRADETDFFKSTEAELTAAIHAYAEQQGKDAVEAERRKVEATRKGSEERVAAERAILAELASLHLEETSEYTAQLQKVTEAVRAAAEERIKLEELDIEQARISGTAKIHIERQAVQEEFDLHRINAQQRIALLEDLEKQEYAIELEAMAQKLALMQSDKSTSPEELQRQLNQVENLTREHNNRLAALNTQGAKQSQQAFDQFFTHVSSQFETLTRAMLQGTQTFGKGMQQLWNSLAISYIQTLEKMLLASIQNDLAKLTAHTASNQAEVASDQEAAAQKQGISLLSSLKEITAAAASAAAKAYEAMAGIPVVGPVLGAIAAGTTFSAVMAFKGLAGSAAGGAFLSEDTPLFAHKNEMVLPAPLSLGFKNIIGNMSGAGAGAPGAAAASGASTVHHHHQYNVTVNAGTDRKQMLDMVESELVPMIRSASRRGLLPST